MTNKELSDLRILLVEDDRAHREFVANILENIGYKVMIAFNGKDALPFVIEHKFDIILMDLEMPEMNGIAAARAIRELKRHGEIEDIPIIAITANHDEETEKKCIDAGMVGLIPKHIWKPKWEGSIKEKLQEVLDQRDLKKEG